MVTPSSSLEFFKPRDGRTLKVIRVARVSTDAQDSRSLDDQRARIQTYVESLHCGEVEFIDIASQGSSGQLAREELLELERRIESGSFDLVIAEDLSRICRRRRAFDFCEICIDYDTRLIAINDHIDTAASDCWESAVFATWQHQRSNCDVADGANSSTVESNLG